ncbi:TPA: hypothetical protein N0F65_002102 [Lagenidium giganteum]|uniref:BD-FAE-like domain-containing protein n=1 Tax=Lagenidium giganteum TaxID=4803 RepID=A0AAV2ZKJ4_9STRA|nr:TPA: hypothetical protein N0F65_002102 [Lagenidium giganteum]
MATAETTGVQDLCSPKQMRKRARRFAVLMFVINYVRVTTDSLAAHLKHVAAQSDARTKSRWTLLLQSLKYTLAAQLVTVAEYLICLVKPRLAARIARLLVWKAHQVRADLAYGDHPRHRMDLYGVQTDSKQPPRPVLVFVHGGAWAFGHKWQYGLVGEFLSKHGLLVAVINYRTFPVGTVLDMVHDVEDAVHWLADNAASFGGDAKRMYLSGHSAGAHLCALALARAGQIGDANEVAASELSRDIRTHVRAFIGMSGPYDVEDHYVFESKRVMGPLRGEAAHLDRVHEISPMKPAMQGLESFRQHSPTGLVVTEAAAGNAMKLPRFHIIHGSEDKWVPSSSSAKLVEALQQVQVDAEFHEINNCTHEEVMFALMGEPSHVQDELLSHIHRVRYVVAAMTKTEDRQLVQQVVLVLFAICYTWVTAISLSVYNKHLIQQYDPRTP